MSSTADSEGTVPTTGSGRAKQRTQNACDECRRRKVRCDGATVTGNTCTECMRWGVQCTYNLVKKKRGPKHKSGRPDESIHIVVSEILSSPRSYTPPTDLDTVRDMLIDLASYADRLEKELARFRQLYSSSADSQEPSTGGASSQISTPGHRTSECGVLLKLSSPNNPNDLAERMQESFNLKELKETQDKHYGSSSTFELVKNVLDVKNDLTGENQTSVRQAKRKAFWVVHPWQFPPETKRSPYTFPEDDLMQDLIGLYFTRMNPYFPVLHGPTFRRSVSEGLHHLDRHFGAIVLMVCAFGSLHSDDARTRDDGVEDEPACGWKYFRQINLIHESFNDSLSLYEFQLYPLAAFYLHTTNVSGSAWFLIGLGIRAAHQKGVHRKRKIPSQNAVEDELWKRAFWALIIFDLYGSSTLGRPRATTTDDFDLEYPISCDDEFWENLNSEFEADSSKMFIQPPGKPSIMTFWIHYLKLMEVVAFAHRTIYSIRAPEFWIKVAGEDWTQKAVVELDSRLNEWVDSMPDHLRWDPRREDKNFFYQSAILHATYYWVQFQVHKLFLPRPGETTSVLTFPSLAICANAARSCVHVLEVQHQREPFLPLPMLLGPLFDAALVLLMNLWRGLRDGAKLDPRREMIEVHKCVTMLGMYEQRYQVAGRLCDVLNAMISASHLPAVPDQPSLKRARNLELQDLPQTSLRKAFDSSDADQDIPAATSQLQQLQSMSMDSHLGSYALPCHSQELGEMPIHSSFDSLSSYSGFDLPGNIGATVDNATLPLNFPYKTADGHAFESLYGSQLGASVHHDGHSLDSEELYWQNIGQQEGPFLWPSAPNLSSQDDWNLFMSSVDEMLRSANDQGF